MLALLIKFKKKKRKNEKYNTVGTVPKSNRKIIDRGKTDTPSTTLHDHSLSWFQLFGTNVFVDISLKCKQDEEIHVYKVLMKKMCILHFVSLVPVHVCD
jgi:hypothetical protein